MPAVFTGPNCTAPALFDCAMMVTLPLVPEPLAPVAMDSPDRLIVPSATRYTLPALPKADLTVLITGVCVLPLRSILPPVGVLKLAVMLPAVSFPLLGTLAVPLVAFPDAALGVREYPATSVTSLPPVVVICPAEVLVMLPDARIVTAWLADVTNPVTLIFPPVFAHVGSFIIELWPMDRVAVSAVKCAALPTSFKVPLTLLTLPTMLPEPALTLRLFER